MFGGFAGIFGFSARLTGGGMGDLGRGGIPNGGAFAVKPAASVGAVSERSTPGVGVLTGDLLLCCDTKSRTLASAEFSTLSGERDGLRLNNPLGGDLGESTWTAGVS